MKQNEDILGNCPDAEKIFRVPDGYFESFAKLMDEKTAETDTKQHGRMVLANWWKPVSVAASIAAAIVCTSLYINEKHEEELMLTIEHETLYSQLEDLEIIDYLASEED
ncbi:MAG: hypothetical protein J6Q03_06720 [Paludibacteraceae bacterium]|jgi:hypothetical protein|nr:hypothetical protein [Paludibacteraceae bacterium]MEE1542836.1 hypothetical protein [Paludibacteraceae bacterium]